MTNIITRSADNVVLYAEPDLALTASGATGSNWHDASTTTANATLVQNVTAPPTFVGGAYSYSNGTWTIVNQSLIPVPQTVSRFQAMAALSNAGLLTQAQTAVNASTALAQLAWNNAQSFDRDSPTMAAIAAALNLTSTQVDALFIAAAGITA